MRATTRVIVVLLAVYAALHLAGVDGTARGHAVSPVAASKDSVFAAQESSAISEERVTAMARRPGQLAEPATATPPR
jgi:hypothetical protein